MKHSEDRLISKIASVARALRRTNPGLRLGIGDDAALLKPRSGHEIVLTCDWFLEGSHFLRGLYPPDSIGWKCLARALSDIAAMGGRPTCFLLSIALPDDLTGRWLSEFLSGLRKASLAFDCPLAGGDTTRKREVAISITVVGEVRSGRALLRSGARPGDLIFVSGYLGLAEMGLREQRRKRSVGRPTNPALEKHLYPEPRLRLGQWLADAKLATASMDLSDGLSTDLARLCAASGVGARIEAGKLPLLSKKKRQPRRRNRQNPSPIPIAELLDAALNGGEDYELLFTVLPHLTTRIPSSFHGTLLTCIGQVTRDSHVILQTAHGDKPLHPAGWDPFRRKT